MKSMKWWMANCKKYKTLMLVLSLLLITTLASGCSIFPKEQAEEEIPIIEPPKISKKPEMTVQRGTIEIKAKGQGKVFSNTEQQLYFVGSDEAPSSGTGPGQTESFRIKEIYVQPGQQVAAGEVLAELETKDLDLEIENSANRLKIEEEKLIVELRKEPTTEEERLAQEQMKADFKKLQIEHQKLVRKMQNSQIIAPFDGIVEAVFYSNGSQVNAYQPVILLIDPTDLVVGVRMSQKDMEAIQIDQEASVEINGVNQPLTGRIVKIPNPNQNNQGGGNWQGGGNFGNFYDEKSEYVLIKVDQMPPEVKRGLAASASVVLQRKENVIKIPLSFLHTFSGRNYVVVTDEQGKREVDVELGIQSATEVEIVSGLQEGQRIIGR